MTEHAHTTTQLNNIPLYTHTTFIYLFIKGLRLSHTQATGICYMNTAVHFSLSDPDFTSFGETHRSGIARAYGRWILNIHWKDWCWSWGSNTLATWCEELTHWKKPWCWEKLRAGEGDGWQRMRWLDSITDSMDTTLSKLWETVKEKPGVLQSMGSQRVGHDLVTEHDGSTAGFFEESPHCFPQCLYHVAFLPTEHERSLVSTPSTCRLLSLDESHSAGV